MGNSFNECKNIIPANNVFDEWVKDNNPIAKIHHIQTEAKTLSKSILQKPIPQSQRIQEFIYDNIDNSEITALYFEFASSTFKSINTEIPNQFTPTGITVEKLALLLFRTKPQEFVKTANCYLNGQKYAEKRFAKFITAIAKKFVENGIFVEEIQKYIENEMKK